MRCYISSSCSSKNSLYDAISELYGFGFKRIELTGNIKYCENIENIICNFRELNNIDFIIHNYLPFQRGDFVLNLATTHPCNKEKTLNLIENAVRFSKKIGKNLYSLHPGFRHDLLPQSDDGFFIKSAVNCNSRDDYYKTLEEISHNMAKDNFKIAVENLAPKDSNEIYSFLCSKEDIFEFMTNFSGMPNVGMLLDLGHLNVASHILNFDKYELLDELFCNYQSRIFEIHVSENNGLKDTHNISTLDSWQIDYLLTHGRVLGDIPVVLEWHNCASEEAFKIFEILERSL